MKLFSLSDLATENSAVLLKEEPSVDRETLITFNTDDIDGPSDKEVKDIQMSFEAFAQSAMVPSFERNDVSCNALLKISIENISKQLDIRESEISLENDPLTKTIEFFKRVWTQLKKMLADVWAWLTAFYKDVVKKMDRLTIMLNHDKSLLKDIIAKHGQRPVYDTLEKVDEQLKNVGATDQSALRKFDFLNTDIDFTTIKEHIARNSNVLTSLDTYLIDLLHTVKLFTGMLPQLNTEPDVIMKTVMVKNDFISAIDNSPMDSKLGSLRSSWYDIHELDAYLDSKIQPINGKRAYKPSSIKVLSGFSRGNRIVFVKRLFQQKWVYVVFTGKESIGKKNRSKYGSEFTKDNVFHEMGVAYKQLDELLNNAKTFSTHAENTLKAITHEKDSVIKFMDGLSDQIATLNKDVLNKLFAETKFIIHYLETHASACGRFTGMTMMNIEDASNAMHEVLQAYKKVYNENNARQ